MPGEPGESPMEPLHDGTLAWWQECFPQWKGNESNANGDKGKGQAGTTVGESGRHTPTQEQ